MPANAKAAGIVAGIPLAVAAGTVAVQTVAGPQDRSGQTRR
jgi:hypothetical protein